MYGFEGAERRAAARRPKQAQLAEVEAALPPNEVLPETRNPNPNCTRDPEPETLNPNCNRISEGPVSRSRGGVAPGAEPFSETSEFPEWSKLPAGAARRHKPLAFRPPPRRPLGFGVWRLQVHLVTGAPRL